MEELKQHTESHHYTQYSMKATTPINWTAYMVTTSMCWERWWSQNDGAKAL